MPTPKSITAPFEQVAFHHQATVRNKSLSKVLIKQTVNKSMRLLLVKDSWNVTVFNVQCTQRSKPDITTAEIY